LQQTHEGLGWKVKEVLNALLEDAVRAAGYNGKPSVDHEVLMLQEGSEDRGDGLKVKIIVLA
jgi:hypothetical protein